MDSLADLFNQLGIEGWEVIGLATGDESVVDDDFFINPGGPSVLEVRLDRLIRSHSPTGGHPSIDQSPGTMTDGGNRFTSVEECFHELKRPFIAAKFVRVHNAARQN